MTTTQLHELLTTFAPDGVHVSRTRLFLILMSIHYRTQNQSRRVTATNLYNPRQHTTPNLLSILCTPWEDWVQTRSVDVLENFRFPAGILFQTTLKFVYCFLLRYYAESSGNFLPTFRDNLSVSYSRGLDHEEGTDRLSRNVGKKLPLLAS